MRRIAFDLDETLGVPLIEGAAMAGWQVRPGAVELLQGLRSRFTLLLWSVGSRRYVERALSFELGLHFTEVYAWEDVAASWKDVRRVRADFLVDDSPHHREHAARWGLESAYIVVPAYGSPEDTADPLAWVRLVEARVLGGA